MRNQFRLLFIAFTICLCFLPQYAAAAEEVLCLKYKKEYGWSKGYTVSGHILSGSDLSQKTGNFSRFKFFSTYVVVFWDNEEASIFELPALSFGIIPILATEVEDQQGRKWKIQKGGGLCI